MDISKELSKVIDVLAQKLGVAASKIMPILYKQAKYDYSMDVLWVVVCGILSILFCIVIYKMIKLITTKLKFNENVKYTSDEKEWFIEGAVLVISIFMILIMIIIIVPCFNELIQIKVNPEYYIYNNYILKLIQK